MTQVLDTYAVIAYLEKEPGYEKVRDALARATETGHDLLMTSVNWGEVFYTTFRERGEAEAEQVLQLLESFPIEVVAVDQPIAKQAGVYKACGKISYADCFAAALAKLRHVELLTGDQEFKQVENDIKIRWID